MKIALVTDGTWGDVLPFAFLAKELISQQHDVTLYANEFYRQYAIDHAIPFVAVTTAALRSELLLHPELWHPTKGVKVVGKASQEIFEQSFDILHKELRGMDMIVGYTFTFAAHTIAELHNIPCMTMCISPIQVRSFKALPTFFKGKNYSFLPHSLKKLFYLIGDTCFIDPYFKKKINVKRKSLGLNPITSFVHWSTLHFPSIGLWPEWYAPKEPDQSALQLTDFPQAVEFEEHIDAELDAWIQQGSKPIIITMGSGYMFYESILNELSRVATSSLRFIVIATGHTQDISLASHLCIVPYVALSRVLPLCAAFAHHGGAGTIAQAIRAGIPQLVIPMSHDQPDNASRIEKHHLGAILWKVRPTGNDIAEKIKDITQNALIAESCMQAKHRSEASHNAMAETARIIARFRSKK